MGVCCSSSNTEYKNRNKSLDKNSDKEDDATNNQIKNKYSVKETKEQNKSNKIIGNQVQHVNTQISKDINLRNYENNENKIIQKSINVVQFNTKEAKQSLSTNKRVST